MSISPDAIRNPAVAGRFYPDDPADLRKQIQTCLDAVGKALIQDDIFALIAPHAGYAYSGATAAASFRHLAGLQLDTVFVLSPSHYDAFEGVSVYTGAGYRTPLGVVPVDQVCTQALIDDAPDLFQATDLGHREEHGIEVELPFLQILLEPGWQLVPLVMAEWTSDTCQRVAEAILAASSGRKTLLIASSDLYHGYDYEACRASDDHTLVQIKNLDLGKFVWELDEGTCQACGGGPITVAMHIARQSERPCSAEILAHTTSADVTGTHSGYMVGYGAVAMYKAGEETGDLNENERRQLLRMARIAIETEIGVASGQVDSAETYSDQLKSVRGVFVTLKCQGELRGCVGQVHTQQPLYKAVQDAARAAATQDPRFLPVEPEESKGLTISISILSPFTPVIEKNRIRIGRDGLYIQRDSRSGLLLPQVAEERGWDADTFLASTCQKAGLPYDAWQASDTEVFVFSTEEFGDEDA